MGRGVLIKSLKIVEQTATRPSLAVKFHEMDTAFLSKTLFTIPSITIAAETDHERHRHRPLLNATPIDNRHLLVTYTSPGWEEGNCVSSVHIVRLGAEKLGGSARSSRISLPIVSIAGCVRDYYISAMNSTPNPLVTKPKHPSTRISFPVVREHDLDSNENTMIALPSQTLTSVSPRSGGNDQQPTLASVSVSSSVSRLSGHARAKGTDETFPTNAGNYVYTNNVPQSGKKDTEKMNNKCNINSNGSGGNPYEGALFFETPTQSAEPTLHTFLFSDAATHSIWALEIDTDTLTARVVPPRHYWEMIKNAQCKVVNKKAISPSAHRARALLGGKRGFVDGPFHAARFAFPSTMCWRVDPSSTAVRPTVLFVSDIGNHAIRYVNFCSKMVRTIVGINGIPGYCDGEYRLARLCEATALSWCSVGLLFADGPNGAIRLITNLQHDYVSPTPATSAQASRGVSKSRFATPKVWSIAGGSESKNNGVFYVDARESYRAALGLPSALALMPGGNGILFADGIHPTLRVLTDRGVETIVGPTGCEGSAVLPSGLLPCSDLSVCNIVRRHTVTGTLEKRLAFLVASATQRAVSLIIPHQGTDEEKGRGAGDNINHDESAWFQFAPSASSLNPVYETWISGRDEHPIPIPRLFVLKINTLQTLHDNGTRESSCQASLPSRDRRRQKHYESEEGSQARSAHAPETAIHSRSMSSLSSPSSEQMSHELREATQRLFLGVYMNYAADTMKHKGPTAVKSSSTKYSLSLLCFWRFVTHAEYYTLPPIPPLSSPPPETPPINESERVLFSPWSIHNKHAVVEVLHRLSVRHRGYHVYSTMGLDFFCRVVVFLHRNELHGDAALGPADDAVKIAAYNDAVHRISAAGRNEEEEMRFQAADITMRLLMRNEDSLRQLFEAYSKSATPCRYASATTLYDTRKNVKSAISLARRLRSKLCASDPVDCRSSAEWATTMVFDQFRSLFKAVDVFPTLISQSLLEQAFTDAVSTPLFHRLKQAVLRSDSLPQEKIQQSEKDRASPSMSHGTEKAAVCHGSALHFIAFIEAFTRVALTTFSLCGERDREMYPTAASKVTALMRWINRAFEIDRLRGRQDNQHLMKIGELECGAVNPRTHALFPSNFNVFDLRATGNHPHSSKICK